MSLDGSCSSMVDLPFTVEGTWVSHCMEILLAVLLRICSRKVEKPQLLLCLQGCELNPHIQVNHWSTLSFVSFYHVMLLNYSSLFSCKTLVCLISDAIIVCTAHFVPFVLMPWSCGVIVCSTTSSMYYLDLEIPEVQEFCAKWVSFISLYPHRWVI